MTACSVETTVLQWLDFDYQPPCDAKKCEQEAVSTLRFRPHEGCNGTRKWYAACFAHTDVSLNDLVQCQRCGGHLEIATVLYL